MIRVVRTIGLVFYPGLFDLVPFTTERTYEPSLDLGSGVRTMLGQVVLTHPLSTCILLTTVRACNPVTCHTSLCVHCPHPFGGKHLPPLTTWEFLITVYPYVNHQVVVGFERLLAHWTVFPLSGYSRNLVGNLCDFPGLGSLGQVLPMKKSQYLQLDLFQGSLLHHYFIISRVRLQWLRNLSRSTKSSSGYPRCGRQTLSLILACQPNHLIILSVCWMFHLPPGHLQN